MRTLWSAYRTRAPVPEAVRLASQGSWHDLDRLNPVTDRPMDPFLANAAQPLGPETYIVLDITGPVASEIRRVRARHNYDFYGALPVEITVAGSSGIGSAAPDQDARDVFLALDRVAAETPTIEARFGPVLRFPDTDIFVLTVQDPSPFADLHERLRESGVRFLESPFPFTPHCTLRGQVSGSPSPQEVEDLMATTISGSFQCETLSTYVMEGFPLLTLRHRSHLAGPNRGDLTSDTTLSDSSL